MNDADNTDGDKDAVDLETIASVLPKRLSELQVAAKIKPIPKASSLFMFSYANPFRRTCHRISNHRWFSNSLLVCIIVSSIMLSMEDPVKHQSATNDVTIAFQLFIPQETL